MMLVCVVCRWVVLFVGRLFVLFNVLLNVVVFVFMLW